MPYKFTFHFYLAKFVVFISMEHCSHKHEIVQSSINIFPLYWNIYYQAYWKYS